MIYDTIRAISKEKNITIRQIEEELGFARSSICKWNENIPSVEKVKKVADILGCSIDNLLASGKGKQEG